MTPAETIAALHQTSTFLRDTARGLQEISAMFDGHPLTLRLSLKGDNPTIRLSHSFPLREASAHQRLTSKAFEHDLDTTFGHPKFVWRRIAQQLKVAQRVPANKSDREMHFLMSIKIDNRVSCIFSANQSTNETKNPQNNFKRIPYSFFPVEEKHNQDSLNLATWRRHVHLLTLHRRRSSDQYFSFYSVLTGHQFGVQAADAATALAIIASANPELESNLEAICSADHINIPDIIPQIQNILREAELPALA